MVAGYLEHRSAEERNFVLLPVRSLVGMACGEDLYCLLRKVFITKFKTSISITTALNLLQSCLLVVPSFSKATCGETIVLLVIQ
jgi:hypothetical protein